MKFRSGFQEWITGDYITQVCVGVEGNLHMKEIVAAYVEGELKEDGEGVVRICVVMKSSLSQWTWSPVAQVLLSVPMIPNYLV